MAEGHVRESEGGSAETGDESPDRQTTVLVVDDDSEIRESFTVYLEPSYQVRTGADLAEARRQLDDEVDIALIERQLPDGTGDEFLAEVRSRNLDCQVALVTSVDPDFGIVEIDCDDYLVKPVEESDLVETVERLEMINEYSEKQRRLSSLRVKRNVLEVEKSPEQLAENEEFQGLEREIDALETELDELESEFDDQLGYDEL